METEKECCICCELITTTDDSDMEETTLSCGHCFHDTCISKWFKHSNTTCPICRKDLTISKFDAIDVAIVMKVAKCSKLIAVNSLMEANGIIESALLLIKFGTTGDPEDYGILTDIVAELRNKIIDNIYTMTS